jgi:RNA polymerase subunit RPABC4/transcription elongation factor Spt4
MNMIGLRCPHCQTLAPADARYCPLCGEAIGPELVTELRGLAAVLRDLDERIAAGKGALTVEELRDDYAERYKRLRQAPPGEARPAGPLTRPLPAAQTGSFKKTLATPAAPPAAQDEPLPQAPARPPAAPAPAAPRAPLGQAGPVLPRQPGWSTLPAQPAPQAPTAQAAPQGHAFSWRAFITDQAIAIIAYLGGFLALVATLTFVVSKGQGYPTLSLLVICAVYLAFGGAGLALRRSTDLRTVRRVYLGVFAFMTPLVMLAIYRFALKDFNVPVSAMLCISALYATVVYLALTLETRFMTYAYLGWTSLVVAALAIVPWVNSALRVEVTLNWWGFTLGVMVLVLLMPRLLRERLPLLDLLHEPATQLAVLATFPLVLAVQVFGAIGLDQLVNPFAFPTVWIDPAALALSACVQVPVTLAWRRVVPGWRPQWGTVMVDVIDGFNAVFFAEAVGGVALWIGADGPAMTRVLSATALLEFGLAFWMFLRQPQRRGLRRFVEFLAVGLICGGALTVQPNPSPNWPLITALSAGLVVTVGSALIDSSLWLLASGFFLGLTYHKLALALLPAFYAGHLSQFWLGLTLAVWTAALWLGTRAEARRLVWPVYVVALANALYLLPMLLGQDPTYQVEVILILMAAALSAGVREHKPGLANLVVGFFGLLVALPYFWQNFSFNGLFVEIGRSFGQDTSALHEVWLALGLAGAALAARWRLGRAWAVALYLVALWTVALAGLKSLDFHTVLPDWSAATGLPFMAWVLLFFAALATLVALWEKQPLITLVSGGLALWAIALISRPTAGMVLIFALIGVGAALRQWRGRGWGWAWLVAAGVGVRLVVPNLTALPGGFWWQVGFLLAVALCAYLVAVQEEQPMVSGVAVLYAVIAAWFIQGAHQFALTVGLTFLLAVPGVVLRVPPLRGHVRREWAYAPYAAAIGASLLACTRVLPFNANTLEALLLVFAAVAYVLVVLEGEPFGGVIPTLYAMASVFVQRDAHALLPLALSFALLALIAGRVAGARWAWPFYAAAVTAALATAYFGAQDPSFEAVALTLLALMTYLIAAVEVQPDVLAAALLVGVIALATGAHALHWAAWQTTLAFAALGWFYQAGQLLWPRLPWIRPAAALWWLDALKQSPQQHAHDPRLIGKRVHLAAGLVVAVGTVLLALNAPGAFARHNLQTLAISAAMVLLAGMLVLLARVPLFHAVWYLSGLLVAIAVTWLLRWLGADNVQAFVVAPGSYLLIAGTFLPADQRVPERLMLGKLATLAGSLLLLVPSLYQSYNPEPNFTYELVLIFESLVIVALGVGTRWRYLILTGSAFVGVAALSGVSLALQKGVPIALVVGCLALVLIIAATWLSLRRRRTVGHTGE